MSYRVLWCVVQCRQHLHERVISSDVHTECRRRTLRRQTHSTNTQSTSLSQLDYCNSLPYGAYMWLSMTGQTPQYSTSKLQQHWLEVSKGTVQALTFT